MGHHQANLQPNLLLFNSRLRFNHPPTFLGVTFYCTPSFLNMYLRCRPSSSLFSRPYAVFLLSDVAPLSPSLLYKAFLRPLLIYALSGWFPFLSVTNITKLEHLHRAASRAVSGCFSSSSLQLLFSEASLPPLRVTLTHFTLSSYERALCFTTSFSISDLARFGVKPRLYKSSWRAFESTHPLMLPSTSPRKLSLIALSFLFMLLL